MRNVSAAALFLWALLGYPGQVAGQVAASGYDTSGNAALATTIGPDAVNQHAAPFGTANIVTTDSALFAANLTQTYLPSSSLTISLPSGSYQYMSMYFYLQTGGWHIDGQIRTLIQVNTGGAVGSYIVCRLVDNNTGFVVTYPDGTPVGGIGAYASTLNAAYYGNVPIHLTTFISTPGYYLVYCARFGTTFIQSGAFHDSNGATVVDAIRGGY